MSDPSPTPDQQRTDWVPDPSAVRTFEIMEDLDEQYAASKWWRPRRIIWRANRGRILGERGTPLPNDGTPYRYGYNRAQVRRMAERLRDAFRSAYIDQEDVHE